MMKRYRGLLLIGIMVAGLSAPTAKAITTVDLLGAVNEPYATGTPSPTGTLGYGGGLRVTLGGRRLALELGGIYMTRNYTAKTTNTIAMIDGDLALRLMLVRFVYLAAGGYGNYYLTNPQPLSGKDIGLFGGLGIKIPFSPTFALTLRGDYHYALFSLTAPGVTITPSEIVGSAALSFGMNLLGGGR